MAGALVYRFSDPVPPMAEVGGKALSLMRMAHAGIHVPPGFVLPVGFFAPWLDTLRSFPAWGDFVAALDRPAAPGSNGPGDPAVRAACDALQGHARSLAWSAEQREVLGAALGGFPTETRFAVRSSSPEEDLEGASFAGGYRTVLNVSPAGIEEAVREVFASCLDLRVAVYKRMHGMDARQVHMAVVVQVQIASDVAGVGFSIDPVTNDYDHAVFSANWGLGESVVAGTVSPDLFTVDRTRRQVLRRDAGRKENTVELAAGGGVEVRSDERPDRLTLDDAQLHALTTELERIEVLYGRPVDVEWAFAGKQLYFLQARPITTHLDLPEDLLTVPGAPRRLYWDASLSVQGMLKPMSVMATSFLHLLVGKLWQLLFGTEAPGGVGEAAVVVRHGRMYVNLSNLFTVVDQGQLVKLLLSTDAIAARILEAVDVESYRAPAPGLGRLAWRLALHAPHRVAVLAEALALPERSRRRADRIAEEVEGRLRGLEDSPLPLVPLAEALARVLLPAMFDELLPRVVAAKMAMSRIRQRLVRVSETEQRLIDRLDQSLPGNVTVTMGLELSEMARLLPAGWDAKRIEQELTAGTAPSAFATAWRKFLGRHGHRGPREIDVAAPRYREEPRLLFEQLAQLVQLPTSRLPDAIHERSRREREQAAQALGEGVRVLGRAVQRRFHHYYGVVEALGGLRETPKFCMVTAIDVLRTRLLDEGARLVAAGRLDRPEQIFDLTLGDVGSPDLDLRARGAERRLEHERLARARELPRIFDSRGRIFYPPPRPAQAGRLTGHPVSPGIARGPVKVLHTPGEKPLRAGEILVARATDPGWTPLLVSAAAVILEVGGVMQHGALVAREYGKPCVAGVEHATERLRDGQVVEVNGAAGVVTLVESTS
jgi:pyruvate,water dikinase